MPQDGVPPLPYVRFEGHRGLVREGEDAMPNYVIERTVPGAGQMDEGALADIADKSNMVLRDLGPDVQWVQSYVVDDKIFCLYRAASPEIIREHGRCGGFPVDAVHEVRA